MLGAIHHSEPRLRMGDAVTPFQLEAYCKLDGERVTLWWMAPFVTKHHTPNTSSSLALRVGFRAATLRGRLKACPTAGSLFPDQAGDEAVGAFRGQQVLAEHAGLAHEISVEVGDDQVMCLAGL